MNFGTQSGSMILVNHPATPSSSIHYNSVPTEIQAILDQITTDSYGDELTSLAVTIGSRMYGTTQNEEAAEYIASVFSDAGLEVSFHHFGSGAPNVIGTLHGGNANNNECIVVGAHFDTFPSSSKGADDNGSGIAAVLEMAKSMSQYYYNYTIHFVGFNAEEIGLVGSSAYANKLENENIPVALMYNFDMLLWESPNAPVDRKLEIIHNGGVSGTIAQDIATIGQTWLGAPIQTNHKPAWTMSDHAPFWGQGIPAVWFFEYNGLGNPYIHSSLDHLGQPEYSIPLGTLATQTATAALADYATIVSTELGFPDICFVSPIGDSFTSPDDSVPVVLAVDDEFNDITQVELSINDEPWIDITAGLNTTHCTYLLNAASMYGPVSMKARVTDAAGWVAYSQLTTIFDEGIYCEIHSPHTGDVLVEGIHSTIWINVTDPDGYPIRLVQVRINSSTWEQAIKYIPGSVYYYNWTVTGHGSIPIEAFVVDANGNYVSVTISVIVESFPPVISDVSFLPTQPFDTDVVTISAMITQDIRGTGIFNVLVHYDIDTTYWRVRKMEPTTDNLYILMLGPYPAGTQIRFYIEAIDYVDNSVINDNNGLYYTFIFTPNPTPSLLMGVGIALTIAIVMIAIGLFVYLRNRRKIEQLAS
ncbi:MAG: M28 family metallopeptidase [Promethearchaeota archaeon]